MSTVYRGMGTTVHIQVITSLPRAPRARFLVHAVTRCIWYACVHLHGSIHGVVLVVCLAMRLMNRARLRPQPIH